MVKTMISTYLHKHLLIRWGLNSMKSPNTPEAVPAFMGFVMPEAPRPKAKIRPEDKGDMNLGCAGEWLGYPAKKMWEKGWFDGDTMLIQWWFNDDLMGYHGDWMGFHAT